MENKALMRKMILNTVSTQLRTNNPPETKKTLERLMSEGYSRDDARELIAGVVVYHIYSMLSKNEEFDEKLYVEQLKRLPYMPEGFDG